MALVVLMLGLVEARLVGVVELFRHGARSPQMFVDEFGDMENWPEGKEELVPEGMRQHYLLGTYSREKLVKSEGLLSERYDTAEIYVFSSDFNRTLMSAQSYLSGLYSAGTGPKLRQTNSIISPPIQIENLPDISSSLSQNALPFNTQLIPIHSKEFKSQYALNPSSACNYYKQLSLAKKSMKDERNIILSEYPEVLDSIMKNMNYSLSKAQDEFMVIMDSMISYEFRFESLPLNFSKSFFVKAKKTHDKLKNYHENEPDLLARFSGTGFFIQVLNHFEEISQNKTSTKLFAYSAHDSTMQAVFSFLKLDTTVNPPFASLVSFDLIQDEDSLKVEIIFNGRKLEMGACESGTCSLEEFKDFVNRRSISGFFEICKTDPSDEVIESLRGKIKIEDEAEKNKGVEERRDGESIIVSGYTIGAFFMFSAFWLYSLSTKKPTKEELLQKRLL